MKKGWQLLALGDVCEVIGGGTPRKDKPALYSGDIPWATVRDMRQDIITETEFSITEDAVRGSATNVIPAGNVVIATRVGLGKVCLTGRNMAINQDLRGIIPRSDEALAVRYLFWWLKSIADAIIAQGTGATVQGVRLPFLKALQIPVPRMAEQQRIVSVLDEAFEGLATAKANAERNVHNSRALFESHLQFVFTQRGPGWVETTIGAEVKFIDYRGKTPVKTPSGVRLITAKNVKMGYLQETPTEFIAASSYKGWMSRGIPQKGDVLFTTEAPLANVAQLDTEEKCAFAQRIIVMQPNAARLDGSFLKYLLLSQPVQQRIRMRGTGATVQGIKASLLKLIEISFPEAIVTQRAIAAECDALNEGVQSLLLLYKRKLAALDELKKALLHQAYSAQL